MRPLIALSFESVDAANAALTAELVRLLGGLAARTVAACDVGIDRASRFVGIRAELPSPLGEEALRRLRFWTARALGHVRLLPAAASDEACALETRLRRCQWFLGSAEFHQAAAAIRAVFLRGEPHELRAAAPASHDLPVLVLCVSGPASEGLTYDRGRRELFVPSALSPPIGDACILRLVSPGRPPVAVRARVVERPASEGAPAPAGFALSLEGESAAAHALLAGRLGASPGPPHFVRRAPRHRLLGPVHIRGVGETGAATEAPRRAFLRDLSAGGAFVRTDAPLPVGERVQLEARLPNGGELRARGTVVHARAEGMGLKFDEQTAGADALAGAVSALGGRPPRILVIDDDALVREMLADAFRGRGYEVVTAPDATFGIHALTDQLFALDLLVTDVLMSGIDGEALVRTIRKVGGEADLPILVVTASPEPSLAERLRELGANEIVAKSAGVAAIVGAADALLERASSPGRTAGRSAAGRELADEERTLEEPVASVDLAAELTEGQDRAGAPGPRSVGPERPRPRAP